MDKQLAKAHALGVKDAKQALDSGDYGYHRTTKGLSVVTLRDDMWSFREDAFKKLGAEAFTAWKQGWKEGLAGPAKPSLDDVLKKAFLDWRDLDGVKEVPKELSGVKTVKAVSIRMYKLTKFERIFTMPNVERAYLSKLGLKSVPKEISAWKKLAVLSLSENPLTDIDAVCGLTSLEELDLSSHRLQRLPDALGQLKNLEELDLFQAKSTLTSLPASLANLKQLRTVRLPLDGAELKKQLKKLLPKVKVS